MENYGAVLAPDTQRLLRYLAKLRVFTKINPELLREVMQGTEKPRNLAEKRGRAAPAGGGGGGG